MTVNFPEFIEKKYLEWQNREGKRKSVEEFAMYIGVSQPAISHWMSGKRTPSAQTAHLLAEIFGDEVYDVLGLQRPNPYLQLVNRRWEFLDEATQKRIAEEVAGYETQNENERVQKTPKPRKAGSHK